MKIYTRTGDAGQTSLFADGRVSKDNVRMHAYGSVDELNSLLGVVLAVGLSDVLSAGVRGPRHATGRWEQPCSARRAGARAGVRGGD